MPRDPRVRVAGVDHPPTVNTETAARWLSCTPELLQRERGTGRLPVEPIALGRRLRWPTFALAAAAGLPVEITPPDAEAPDAADGGEAVA